ncbi:MAG TPA: glycosyltransferase family 2 protein [Balneolales bacterium]|nr:glycosyltransferase family 2 protein [Balneolales bacterium]
MDYLNYSLYGLQYHYSNDLEAPFNNAFFRRYNNTPLDQTVKPVAVQEALQPYQSTEKEKPVSDYLAKLAVVMPAHNEEKVIGNTLETLLQVIDPSNIFVVSDASTDKTEEIVLAHGVNFLKNETNLGKTRSLKRLIREFSVLENYDYMFILDADTIPHPEFFARTVRHFKNPKVACVCGHVVSEEKLNLFVAHRSVMYFIWQNIYKRITVPFDGVTIAPGTASLYRTSVLKHVDFNEGLIIEDFDMTFQVHRKKLGKIIYEPGAKIITQDPDNFRDYFRQVTRWQLGFVQTVVAHRVPFGWQPFDIAIVLLSLLDIVHSFFLLTIIPLLTWFYVLGGDGSGLGHTIVGSVLLRMLIGEIALMWGFSLMQMTLNRDFSTAIYGPFLWSIQYVNIAANFKAYYMAIFKSVNGAWKSPTRR